MVILYLQCAVLFFPTGSVSFKISSPTTLDTTSSPTSGTWKVFVIGGYDGYGGREDNSHSDTEKVDPMVPKTNCDKPPNFPVKITGPITELVGEKSVISCGGHDWSNGKYSSACYEYDLASSNWKLVGSMANNRLHAASVVLGENQIWITGGGNIGNWRSQTKTTEIFDFETKTFKNGPDLPESTRGHCMTKYNQSHVFIGGVYNNDDISHNKCYLVDTENDPFLFHDLPNLFKGRTAAG